MRNQMIKDIVGGVLASLITAGVLWTARTSHLMYRHQITYEITNVTEHARIDTKVNNNCTDLKSVHKAQINTNIRLVEAEKNIIRLEAIKEDEYDYYKALRNKNN